MELFLQAVLNGLIIGGTYALMAIGLTFLLGFMELVNYSHGEFYMLGAYFTYFLIVELGLPHLLGIPLAIIIAFLLGLVVERVLLRPIWHKGVLIRMLMTVGLMITLPNLVTVTPVSYTHLEVKSSNYRVHRSIDEFSKKYSDRIHSKCVVHTKDLKKSGDLLYLPFYLVQFIR